MDEFVDNLLGDMDALPPTSTGNPFAHEGDREITLRFDFSATQSVMHKADPDNLVLGYTRTMMGFLMFQPKPERIAMIGLGGGSLAKYCLRHIPDVHFTAIEINPRVIALRDKFRIPPDGPKFKVICADGAVYVRNRSKLVDVLLIDGFNQDGQARQLCSAEFYAHCYAKLRKGGVLVVNMLNSDRRCATYITRIRERFDDQVIAVEAELFGNRIVFAYKGTDFPLLATRMREGVGDLGPMHTISLHVIAQKVIEQIEQHPLSIPA